MRNNMLEDSLHTSSLHVPEKDLDSMISDLQSGRLPSSDGEFSEIAKKEFERLSQYQLDVIRDLVKTESEDINLEDPLDLQKLRYSSSNSSTALNPPLSDWCGQHDFELLVSDSKKKRNATYEPTLKKLYVQQNRAVTINVSYNVSSFVKENISVFDGSLQLRAVAVFTEPEWHAHPVNVCYEHSRNSMKELKNPLAEHLIRCLNSESTYHQDSKSGRFSVLTNLPLPSDGTTDIPLNYKFMDLVGCSGGINRRDLSILFSFEYLGVPIGRKLVPIRICANPYRDMKAEMVHLQGKATKVLKKDVPVKSPTTSAHVFWVPAFDSETYEAMLRVGELAETLKPNGQLDAWRELVASTNKKSTTDHPTEGPPSKKMKMN